MFWQQLLLSVSTSVHIHKSCLIGIPMHVCNNWSYYYANRHYWLICMHLQWMQCLLLMLIITQWCMHWWLGWLFQYWGLFQWWSCSGSKNTWVLQLWKKKSFCWNKSQGLVYYLLTIRTRNICMYKPLQPTGTVIKWWWRTILKYKYKSRYWPRIKQT